MGRSSPGGSKRIPDHARWPARSTVLGPLRGLLAAALVGATLLGGWPGSRGVPVTLGARDDVRIAGAAPASLDPARSGDIGSAALVANLFEGLTAFDAQLNVRPALASSWDVDPEWRRVVFQLRPGLTFSDGTPLGSEDVVRSWLRLIDPARLSPLASLLDDVEGAREYASGANPDPDSVGIRALPGAVEVRFRGPAPWFIATTGSPSLAIVPPTIDPDGAALRPGDFVGSGAYVLEAVAPGSITLLANDRYWAGRPAIGTVTVVTALPSGPTAAFRSGEVDQTAIPRFEALWIRYDSRLGPSLRREPSLSVEYFGFDTSRPPFDDVRVRRAFGAAVDWRGLSAAAGVPDEAANSLVPPAIPGRSDEDLLPAHDPVEARRLLAEAGYPAGAGFPEVTLESGGSTFDTAVGAALLRELGLTVRIEVLADFTGRIFGEDRPQFWAIGWVADYPDPYDFLGILLGPGQVTNFGRWDDPAFEAALDRAASARLAAERAALYVAAERIVRSEVPLVPVAYPTTWALSREGLLGADSGGIGILRFGGLAWGDQ